MSADGPVEVLKGTLDLMILRTLELAPLHGAAIADRIAQTTRGTFQVKAGSLFPALHRLEEQGWLASEWGASENKRRARYYRLTRAGRRRLQEQVESWEQIALAMKLALESA
jgi:transcriptional regulator